MSSADHRALREAADWFAAFQAGQIDDSTRQAWRQWLATPDHARAWQRVEQISGQFRQVAADEAGRAASGLWRERSGRRHALKTLGLVAAAGSLGWLAGGHRYWQHWNAPLQAAVGEVRRFGLADGSRLWLNSGAAASAELTASTRRLTLYQGELLLETVDRPVPFELLCASGTLHMPRASRLSLRQQDDAFQLSVFDGEVRLRSAGAHRVLEAGQQIRFDARGPGATLPVDQARLAWTRGILLANDRRLGDVIAELASHRRGHLGCDPAITDLRVVGAFPLGDTDRILDALAATLAVRIHRPLPWWTSVEAA